MTLNGVMTLILRYFAEFGSFRGLLPEVVAQPSTDSFPRNVMKYTNCKHDGRAVPFMVKSGGLQLCLAIAGLQKSHFYISSCRFCTDS